MADPLPGFRFYPTEEELVSFYLSNKLKGTRTDIDRVIPVLDIYDYNPWDLPQFAGQLCPADSEQWFFFTPRQEREARGGRPNRLTTEGYWKATGSPGDVYSSRNNCVIIGRKRTMVFYVGRAPNGRKTNWKMNEYKAIFDCDEYAASSSSASPPNPQLREEISLCRIYKKSRSLRAFDRRPPSDTEAAAAHRHHHGNDAAILLNHHPISIVPEITDSSSPPQHNTTNINPSHSNLENENDIPVTASSAGEPFWDSDDFNLFDLSKIM